MENRFPFFFRLATEEDLGFIQQLSVRVFSIFGNYDEILTRWFLQPLVTTVIPAENNNPLGFGMLLLEREGYLDPSKGEILAIAVLPEYQKRGIGNALLYYLESLALQHGLNEIQLHTAQDNTSARSFFQKADYNITGSKKSYYPKGQPAFMMTKILDS